MPISDKQRQRDNALRKKLYHQIAIRFRRDTDKDVIDWLLSQKNMKDAIVQLVRNQIEYEEQN